MQNVYVALRCVGEGKGSVVLRGGIAHASLVFYAWRFRFAPIIPTAEVDDDVIIAALRSGWGGVPPPRAMTVGSPAVQLMSGN